MREGQIMKIEDPYNAVGKLIDEVSKTDAEEIIDSLNALGEYHPTKRREPKTKLGKFLIERGIYHWNLRYALLHPWEIIEEAWDRLIYAWQRAIRGWDYRQTWSIDWAYSKIFAELLTEFKKVNDGVPISMIEAVCGEDYELGSETPEQLQEASKLWDETLDEMIDGFSYYSNEKYETKDYDLLDKKITRALELFSKHFRDLWW